MTVVVAFNCSDGVVIAADSMITPSLGGLGVGHHHGQKIAALPGPQLFAFAGDVGQNARFRILAENNHGAIAAQAHAIDFPLALTQAIIQQFTATGINNSIDANPILAFAYGGNHHCCIFEGALQPRLLDAHHYYAALGSGKLSADPFLRFLVDVFCPAGQPTVREAVFLATWAVQHVIDTNPGGVAGPIRIGTFDRPNGGAAFQARLLPDNEIAEHQQAIESAGEALRTWRDQLQSGEAAGDIPDQPEAPAAPAAGAAAG